jgi:hypothetical protein
MVVVVIIEDVASEEFDNGDEAGEEASDKLPLAILRLRWEAEFGRTGG